LTSYRLHYFPESGNSYKIALMLTLCGQTFEPVWTDFAGGDTRTAEWRSTVNELGEIPVLEENGQRFTQTAPILLRLAQRYGRFGGRDEQEQLEVLRWLFWDNHKLTGYMATYRFQRVFTPSPNAEVLRFLKHRLDDFLTILEKQLSDRSFVIGERPTVRPVDDRISPVPKARNRVRFRREPSRDKCMVAAGRSAAWLAGSIRIAARDAHAQISVGSPAS
jgi:glutathione S-transferase